MKKRGFLENEKRTLVKEKFTGSWAGLIGHSLAWSGFLEGIVLSPAIFGGADPSTIENYLSSPLGIGAASVGLVAGFCNYFFGNRTEYYDDGMAFNQRTTGLFGSYWDAKPYDSNLHYKKVLKPKFDELEKYDWYKKLKNK